MSFVDGFYKIQNVSNPPFAEKNLRNSISTSDARIALMVSDCFDLNHEEGMKLAAHRISKNSEWHTIVWTDFGYTYLNEKKFDRAYYCAEQIIDEAQKKILIECIKLQINANQSNVSKVITSFWS